MQSAKRERKKQRERETPHFFLSSPHPPVHSLPLNTEFLSSLNQPSTHTHTHTHTHPHTHAHTHAHTHPHQKPLRSQQPSPQEPVWTSGAFLSSSAERLRTPLPPHPLVRCPLGLSV